MAKARFVGAGFPDYPWLFATDGEFTAFASVALGQFEPIKEHMRALKEASIKLNDSSGKVVHEVVTDGSVYFGANADAGNTDETAKFPSAVALIWRWTGDDAFRDEMYDFAKSNLRVHLPRARHRQGRLAGGPRQRRAARHGRGEARQHDRHDARPARPRGPRQVQGRHRDREVGGRQGRRPRVALRGLVVDGQDPAARRLARRPGQRPGPAAPLDRRHADGDRDRAGRQDRAGPDDRRPRQPGAQPARDVLLRRRLRALPHRRRGLRPRAVDRAGREVDVHAQHLDHGRRRGQLRPPRQEPAAALHDGQPPRAAARPRRAARRDAGDRPVAGLPAAAARPQVHRAGDGAAGVGQLRHRLAGRAPAARRPPRRRPARARGRAAGAGGPAARGRLSDPPRRPAPPRSTPGAPATSTARA